MRPREVESYLDPNTDAQDCNKVDAAIRSAFIARSLARINTRTPHAAPTVQRALAIDQFHVIGEQGSWWTFGVAGSVGRVPPDFSLLHPEPETRPPYYKSSSLEVGP